MSQLKLSAMKKAFILILFIGMFLPYAKSQTNSGCGSAKSTEIKKSMKIGIVISSNDPETVWNAFRFGNYSLNQGDSVSVFLLGKGVEAPEIKDKTFNVIEMMTTFAENKGKIMACGTCLQLRKSEGSHLCPVSTLSDLYEMIQSNEKILTF